MWHWALDVTTINVCFKDAIHNRVAQWAHDAHVFRIKVIQRQRTNFRHLHAKTPTKEVMINHNNCNLHLQQLHVLTTTISQNQRGSITTTEYQWPGRRAPVYTRAGDAERDAQVNARPARVLLTTVGAHAVARHVEHLLNPSENKHRLPIYRKYN